jgi:hypothetical protein
VFWFCFVLFFLSFFFFCFLSFFLFIGYFLYLHFKCYPVFRFPPSLTHPITSSLPLLLWGCSSTYPPTPTSLPSISLYWDIYWTFIVPRTFPSIDAWEDHPLLHMKLEPCILLCWWLSSWELWGSGWLILFYGVAKPFQSFTPSLTPQSQTLSSVQWLAANIFLCICKALAEFLRRQPYQALFSMHYLAFTTVFWFDNCIWDEPPVSGRPLL